MDGKKGSELLVLRVLEKYTDENHYLTQDEISKYIQNEFHVTLLRKAVSSALRTLEELGYDINKAPNGKGVALFERLINSTELTFIVDSLFSSRMLTSRQVQDLVDRLSNLTSIYEKKDYSKIYKYEGLGRSENKDIFYNISVLSEAISRGRKIKFNYYQYDAEGKLVKRVPEKYYTLNPCFLANNLGNYYFVANYDKYNNFVNFRIDLMKDIEILEDSPSKKLEDIPEAGKNFSIAKYLNEHIYIFGGKPLDAKIRFTDPYMLTQVHTTFGKNVTIDKTDDVYTVSFRCDENSLLYWAMQFSQKVEVLEPSSLREKLKEAAQSMLEKYSS